MRKLMMLAAMLAVALVAVAPALAQDDEPAVVADSTGDTPTAKAGGAEAKVDCPEGIIESKAGGVVAKTDCEEPAPKAKAPEPKPAPAPAPAPAPIPYAPAPAPYQLPATGGTSLLALGAGVLLVAGGLLARRISRS